MSHEFRTPLNSVLALSRLLLARTGGDLTPEQERQVQFIRKSAESLTTSSSLLFRPAPPPALRPI
jgi:signal transduction histidine kinase